MSSIAGRIIYSLDTNRGALGLMILRGQDVELGNTRAISKLLGAQPPQYGKTRFEQSSTKTHRASNIVLTTCCRTSRPRDNAETENMESEISRRMIIPNSTLWAIRCCKGDVGMLYRERCCHRTLSTLQCRTPVVPAVSVGRTGRVVDKPAADAVVDIGLRAAFGDTGRLVV